MLRGKREGVRATLMARSGREVEISYVTNSQRERTANSRIGERGRREKESKGKMRERKVSCNQAGVFPVYVSFCFSFSSITIFFYICLLHMYFTLCYKLACCKAVKCSHWVAYYSVTLQTTSLTLISTKLSKKVHFVIMSNLKFYI